MFMSFLKKQKRNIIFLLLIAYAIHAVPVFLSKNTIVLSNDSPSEITLNMR